MGFKIIWVKLVFLAEKSNDFFHFYFVLKKNADNAKKGLYFLQVASPFL
jgi:hypothetical protein